MIKQCCFNIEYKVVFINYRVHWLLLKKKLSFKAFDLFHFFMSFILFSTPEVRAEPILRSRQEKTHC